MWWLYSFVINICHIVWYYLPLLCNHDNLTLKLHHQKNSYLDEGCLFIGRLKVGSVPGMISKVVLAQFIYRELRDQLKNCLPRKIRNLLLYVYWIKRVRKSSNTFDQLLIKWKIQVSRNNLQVYKVRFLICLFKLLSNALSCEITAKMFFFQYYSCKWYYWSCSRRGATIYCKVHTRHNQVKID